MYMRPYARCSKTSPAGGLDCRKLKPALLFVCYWMLGSKWSWFRPTREKRFNYPPTTGVRSMRWSGPVGAAQQGDGENGGTPHEDRAEATVGGGWELFREHVGDVCTRGDLPHANE
jgi:hypothetical protein